MPMAAHSTGRSRPVPPAEVAATGALIQAKYGPRIGWDELRLLLRDPEIVRHPCEVRFDSDLLLPGEFAHAFPVGLKPEDGFVIYVHPVYCADLSVVPYLVLHQLVHVLYGEGVSAEDAELFGSQALGVTQDEYFRSLCDLASQAGGDELC